MREGYSKVGDKRYEKSYAAIANAADRARAIREASDEEIVQALAAATTQDLFLANVLATEAMNRMHRATAVTKHLGEGVLAVNHEAVITFVNPAAEVILGRSASELVGKPVWEGLDVYDAEGRLVPKEERPVWRALRHGERVRWEQAFTRHSSGRLVPVSFVWVPILREADVVGAVVALTDATLRRAAEAERAALLAAERAAREEAQRREKEAQFMAQAGLLLAESLEPRETLRLIARLAVPELADWCAVHVLEEDGTLRTLAVTHTDPARVALAEALQRRYPPRKDAPRGVWHVLRTGQPDHFPELSDAALEAVAQDAEHLRLLKSLGLRSAVVAPLRARGQTLGAITFVTGDESGRRYDERMVRLALDLATRAALALDNARLVAQSRRERP